MKRGFIIVCALLLAACNALTSSDAISYHNKISDNLSTLITSYNTMYSHINDYDVKNAELGRIATIKLCDTTYKNLAPLKGFEGNTSYINAVKKYIAVMKRVLKNEIKNYISKIGYTSNFDNKISDNPVVIKNMLLYTTEIDTINKQIDAKLNEVQQLVRKEQLEFAATNNFTIDYTE